MSELENRSRIFHRGTVALGLTINHIKTVGEINANKMKVDNTYNFILVRGNKTTGGVCRICKYQKPDINCGFLILYCWEMKGATQ